MQNTFEFLNCKFKTRIMPATYVRFLTPRERALNRLGMLCFDCIYYVTCGGFVLELIIVLVLNCALFLYNNGWYKVVVPLIIAFTFSITAYFTIEALVVDSPEIFFEQLDQCFISNVSDAIIGLNPCTVNFKYEWVPAGINPSFSENRLVSVEITQLSSNVANTNFTACELLAQAVSASLSVGSSRCFKLVALYAGYREAFDCAEVSSQKPFPGVSATSCFTLFEPKSSHSISVVATVLFALGLLMVICPSLVACMLASFAFDD